MPGHVSIGVPTASEDTPATSFSSGTIRTTYPESTTGNTSNTLSNASSTATRLAISFHPNQRCTLTLTGGSPTSNPTAAYATSLALLARHPKFSISEKCVRGTTSVAVRFPTEVLEFIPLLNDAFRMRPPAHNDETLTSQLELGVGVRVWALLDLLACAASALHNDGSNLRKTMRGILKKSLEGDNVNALADLRLVAGYMACDDVYKATLDAIAHDLQHASARRRGRPIELQPSALRSDINRTQVVQAFTAKGVPVCQKDFVEACASRAESSSSSTTGITTATSSSVSPSPWPVSSCVLFASDIRDLDISHDVTLAEWAHFAGHLHRMPLRRLVVKLPLHAKRVKAIAAREDPRFTHVPGRSPPRTVDVSDVAALVDAASAGGLSQLRHLGIVHSAMHASCMPLLTRLCGAVGDTLTSLDLTEANLCGVHLRGFADAMRDPYAQRSCAPWDGLSLLRMLRVLCVGRQMDSVTRPFRKWKGLIPNLPGLDRLEAIVIDSSGEEEQGRLHEFGWSSDAEPLEAFAKRLSRKTSVGVFAVEVVLP